MSDLLHTVLFARRRNEAANRWLEENPAVLGGGALLLGAVLLYFGVVGLMTGKTKDKRGNEMTGGAAAISSVVRALMGLGAIGFGIYVLCFGAP